MDELMIGVVATLDAAKSKKNINKVFDNSLNPYYEKHKRIQFTGTLDTKKTKKEISKNIKDFSYPLSIVGVLDKVTTKKNLEDGLRPYQEGLKSKRTINLIGDLKIEETRKNIDQKIPRLINSKTSKIGIIGTLDKNITKENLKKALQKFGSIGDVKIVVDTESAMEKAKQEIEKFKKTHGSIGGTEIDESVKRTSKGIANSVKSIEEAKENIAKIFQGAEVSTYQQKYADEQLRSFVITVREASGNLQHFKYLLSDGGFELTGINEADSGIIQLNKDVEKAKSNALDLLASLDRKTGGTFKGLTQYKELVELANTMSTSADIEKFSNRFKELNAEATKLTRMSEGKDAFNPVVNSIERLKDSGTEIDKIVTKFSKLNEQPQELSSKIESLKAKLVDIQKYLNNDGSFNYKGFSDKGKIENFIVKSNEIKSAILSINQEIDAMASKQKSFTNASDRLANITTKISILRNQISAIGNSDNTTEFTTRLNELQTKLDTLNRNGVLSEEDVSKVQEIDKAFRTLTNDVKVYNSSANAARKSMDLLADKRKLKNNIQSWMDKNSKLTEEFKQRLQALIDKVDEADSKGLTSIRKELAAVKAEAAAAGVTGQATIDKFKKALLGLSGFFSTQMVLNQMINGVNKVVNNVKALETSMIDLKRVTTATKDEYNKFLTESKQNAVDLATSASDLVETTATWSKLGYNLPDSQKLANVTTIFDKVADIDNMQTATNTLVSTLKAFDLGADDAMGVADKINYIADRYSVSAADLAEGLKVSSASLKVAGNDVNQVLALVTGGTEITQNASEMGNALKILSLRIRGSKTELIDMGESTDDMAESTSKLQEKIKALTNVDGNGGFDILTNTGAFKSTYEIMTGIGKVWGKMSSDTNKSALLELIAGKNRANQIAALLSNIGNVEKSYKDSLNSSGKAQKEYNVWLDSIEAKQEKLTSQFEELSNTLVNSDLIKFVYDSGTGILGFLNDVVGVLNTISSWNGSISSAGSSIGGIVGGVLGAKDIGFFQKDETKDWFGSGSGINTFWRKKRNAFTQMESIDNEYLEKYKQRIANISKELAEGNDKQKIWNETIGKGSSILQNSVKITDKAADAENNYKSAVNKAKKETELFGIKSKIASVSVGLLNTAVNALIGFGVGMAISAIVAGIEYLCSASERSAEAVSNTAEKLNELNDEISSIDDYKTKIQELRDVINDSSTSTATATEKREELLKIQDELIKKYGSEKNAVDDITNAINGQINALDNLSGKKSKDWLFENNESIKSARDYINEQVNAKVVGLNFEDLTGDHLTHNNKEKEREADGFVKILRKARNDGIIEDFSKFNNEHHGFISFKSETRDELKKDIEQLIDRLEKEKITNNKKYTDKELETVDYFIGKLKETENYYIDDNYQNQLATYQGAAEKQLQTDSQLSPTFKKWKQAQEDFQTAFNEGADNATLKEKLEEETKLYQEMNDTVDNDYTETNNVSADSIKEQIADMQKQFDSTNQMVKIKIGIEDDLAKSDDNGIKKIEDIAKKHKVTAQQVIKNLNSDGTLNENAPDSISSVYKTATDWVEKYNEANKDATITLEDFLTALTEEKVLLESNSDGTAKVYSFSSNSKEKKQYEQQVKDLRSEYKTLRELQKKLRDGTATSEEIENLLTDSKYAPLGSSIDWNDTEHFGGLSDAIDNLLKGESGDLLQTLLGLKNNNLDTETSDILDSWISLIGRLDSDVANTVNKVSELQTNFSNISSGITSAQSILKEIDNVKNGEQSALSLDTINKIKTDDTLLPLRKYLGNIDELKTATKDFIANSKEQLQSVNAEIERNTNYDNYVDAISEADKKNKSLMKDSVKKIKEQVKYFKEYYGIDITNWENLSDEKKNKLKNTNAEIVAKEYQLVQDLKKNYDLDLENFSTVEQAKAALIKKMQPSINDINELTTTIVDGQVQNIGWEGLGKNRNTVIDRLKKLGYSGDEQGYNDFISGKKSNFNNSSAFKELTQIIDSSKLKSVIGDVGSLISDTIDKAVNKTTSATSETFDWIEKRLDKFKRNTQKYINEVNDSAVGSAKNYALNNVVNATVQELQANRQAYSTYMAYANGVNLSGNYKSLIRNGANLISSTTDENLKKNISLYQQYYTAAMNCLDSVQSLQQQEKQYQVQKLDNVKSYYSGLHEIIQDSIEKHTELGEDENKNVVKNYDWLKQQYSQQINLVESQANNLQSTLNQLVSNGSIRYQSEEWFKWKNTINDCNTNAVKLRKTLSGLDFEQKIDNVTDYWERVNNRISSTIGILSARNDDTTTYHSMNYRQQSLNYKQQGYNYNREANQLRANINYLERTKQGYRYSKAWYEDIAKMDDATQKSIESYANARKMFIDEFDEIAENFEYYNKELEREYSNLEKTYETGKKVLGADYYNKLLNNQEKQATKLRLEIVKLKQEANTLVSQGVSKNSQAYRTVNDKIHEFEDNLADVNNNILKINDNLRDVPLNTIQTAIDDLKTLVDLLKDVQGLREAQGKSTTSDEIYNLINAENSQIGANKQKIANITKRMNEGKYGAVGSEQYQEAFNEVISLVQSNYSLMQEQEKQYDQLIDLGIDGLNKQKEAIQEQNDELEKKLSLEKAIEALEKARYQKNKLIYREGTGFRYEADQKAIQDAQEQLDNQYRQQILDNFDKAIDALEDFKQYHNIYNSNGTNWTNEAKSDNDLIYNKNIHGQSAYTILKSMEDWKQTKWNDNEFKLYQNLYANMLKNSGAIAFDNHNFKQFMSNTNVGNANTSLTKLVKANTQKQVNVNIANGAITVNGVTTDVGNKLSQEIIKRLPTQLIQDLNK